MRDLDDDPKVFELTHEIATELGEPAAGRVALRCPDGGLPCPRKLQVAQAEAMKAPQYLEAVLDEP